VDFKYIDKKWNYLSCDDAEEKLLWEVDKEKIILVVFFLAMVITILALGTIIALELI
jgi:hypothetical protein